MPLFPGGEITEVAAFVSVLSLAHKHKLTYACLTDMLELISLMLPTPNGLCMTAQQLINKFVDFKREAIVHKCCGFCARLLAESSQCGKEECRAANLSDALFIEVPLDEQLKGGFKVRTSYNNDETYS